MGLMSDGNHLRFQKLVPSSVVGRNVKMAGQYEEECSIAVTMKFRDAIKLT